MADPLSGKVCVVTGAGSGIGRQLVCQLVESGARVFALDLKRETLASLEKELPADCQCTTLQVDVTSAEQMEEAARAIHEEAGQVDLLVNNAGVSLVEKLAKVSFAQWRRVLDVNFLGVIHGIHFYYPKMIERGQGHIVNLGSIAGSSGYATADAYATSKGAVIGYTRSLQIEAEGYGVLVSLVCPGYVDTSIFNGSATPGCRREDIETTFMAPPVSAQAAATAILKGIRKRKKSIVFPFSGRMLYFISRWIPFLLPPIQRSLLKRYEAIQS